MPQLLVPVWFLGCQEGYLAAQNRRAGTRGRACGLLSQAPQR